MRDLELLTCSELARMLRLSNATVRQLAAAGELPGRKIGRVWRFPHTAIESFVLSTPIQTGEDELATGKTDDS